jgi:hypothetical protein
MSIDLRGMTPLIQVFDMATSLKSTAMSLGSTLCKPTRTPLLRIITGSG